MPDTTGQQTCPICGTAVPESKRYPRRLCPSCDHRALAPDGRRLMFGTDKYNAFTAWYAETKEVYAGNECYVDGVKCRAGEDYWGGYVVVADDSPKKI